MLSTEAIMTVVNRLREGGVPIVRFAAATNSRVLRVVDTTGLVTDLPIVDAIFVLADTDAEVFAKLYAGRRGQTYDPAQVTFAEPAA